MTFKILCAFFIITLLLNNVCSQLLWNPPYFETMNTEGVEILPVTSGSAQNINMREELVTPISLVSVAYNGPGRPYIGNIISNGPMDTSVTLISGQWVIQILNRQNFEAVTSPLFTLSVHILNDTEFNINTDSRDIRINLINILDNEPFLTYEGPCQVWELRPESEANCTIELRHDDSLELANVQLSINGSHNEHELFYFRPHATDINIFIRHYTLIVNAELRYEERSFYNFKTIATDNANKSTDLTTLVSVLDDHSMNPVWIRQFGTQRFPEKEPQIFTISAYDGDTGINSAICYRLTFDYGDYESFISINEITGEILIDEIDRDAGQDTFDFTTHAFKCERPSFISNSTAVIIVEDINDNAPEITIDSSIIDIIEETYMNLPLSLSVNDRDVGSHAIYTIELLSNEASLIEYEKAFSIIPDKGYQESSFTIIISNATLLDYDDENWRNFELIIMAKEDDNETHIDSVTITINLLNRNDEVPIFDASEYVAFVNESAGIDEYIQTVLATDRDFGDTVIYTMAGISDFLISDEGVVTTASDQVLDYERQQTVILQIRASDTLRNEYSETINTAFAQLIINVLDVNDETPDIRMPRISPEMEENSEDGYIVTDEIYAIDPDTTADLIFSIDWEQTYAVKSGQTADPDLYIGCFDIKTETNATNSNLFHGIIRVVDNFQLDYEEYEVIYLTVKVTDFNQEMNEATAEAILTIRLIDLNDNAPEFNPENIPELRVVEEATIGMIIGSIFAVDIDGPNHNEIEYSIEPRNETVADWITISPTTGEISVNSSSINCDIPEIFYLYYTIIATNNELNTSLDIEILVIDTNNQRPEFSIVYSDLTIEIWENEAIGFEIITIEGHDLDRDYPHNEVNYAIDFRADERQFLIFEINSTTGVIKTKRELDRDNGDSEFNVNLILTDNYLGNRINQNSDESFRIILLDVNDNAPEMPLPNLNRFTVSENPTLDTPFGEIVATDIDDGEHAHLGYTILSVVPGGNNADPVPEDLLEKLDITFDNNIGYLMALESLRGYYGLWSIQIEAFDHGHLGPSQISLTSNETYQLTINEYNFMAPIIVYPESDRQHRLNINDLIVDGPLQLTDGNNVQDFVAFDDDGGIFGDVTFSITDVDTGRNSEYFNIVKVGRNVSRIRLKTMLEAKFYRINVIATDGGDRNSTQVTNVVFVVVDLQGEPVFNIEQQTFVFTENSTGLSESHTITEADDPKNVGVESDNELYPIYYFIDQNYNPSSAELFQLDHKTRILRLSDELDREEIDKHTIRVIATNRENGPSNPDPESMLIINIDVKDVNDNAPEFTLPQYGAGITPNDLTGKIILTVKANDPDLDDSVVYYIVPGSITGDGNNLNAIVSQAFTISESLGEIALNFGVLPSMTGYLNFNVEAVDLANHRTTSRVKIYIIAESNRVTFRLLNTKEYVDNHKEFLIETFNNYFEYECNIDDIQKHTGADGIPIDNQTDVRAHFIDDKFEAIDASIIQSKSNDIIFITQLKEGLMTESISLLDLPINSTTEAIDMNIVLIYLLIVIASLLAATCLALFITYCVRVRSLNRQLKALSETQFGSTTSNLNRREAPTTNVFSVEGSNPVLNNNNVPTNIFDNMSIESNDSDESDFVGIDQDPTFVNDKKESTNSSISEMNKKNLNYNNEFIEKIDYNEKDAYNRDSQLGTYRF